MKSTLGFNTSMSSADAQQIFAAAFTVLERKQSSSPSRRAKALLDRRMPLRARFETAESQQKRILENAAEALSNLWKRSR
jgi:hypothetical protein